MAKLKWSYGETYEKSTLADKPGPIENTPSDKPGTKNHKNLVFDPRDSYNYLECKKENLNSKISDRYLVKRSFQNPFFLEHNYVQDMEIRNEFLIPKISEQEKTA